MQKQFTTRLSYLILSLIAIISAASSAQAEIEADLQVANSEKIEGTHVHHVKTTEYEAGEASIYISRDRTKSIVVGGSQETDSKGLAQTAHSGVYYAVEILNKTKKHSLDNPRFMIGLGFDVAIQKQTLEGVNVIETFLSFPLNSKVTYNKDWSRRASYFLNDNHREVHEISWTHSKTGVTLVAQGLADKDNISYLYLRDKSGLSIAITSEIKLKLLEEKNLPDEVKQLLKKIR